MNDLPQPLTPADCDCRGEPVPADALVQLMMETFGFSVDAALRIVREMAVDLPFPISEVGNHA
jgi:hypothetical protein